MSTAMELHESVATASHPPPPAVASPASPVNVLLVDNPLSGFDQDDGSQHEEDADIAAAAAGLRALALGADGGAGAAGEGEADAAFGLRSLGSAAATAAAAGEHAPMEKEQPAAASLRSKAGYKGSTSGDGAARPDGDGGARIRALRPPAFAAPAPESTGTSKLAGKPSSVPSDASASPSSASAGGLSSSPVGDGGCGGAGLKASASAGSGGSRKSKRLTFSGPPSVGQARPAPRANYSMSQGRVRQILQDNEALVRRLEAITYSRNRLDQASQKHDRFMVNVAASSAARRRTDASRVADANLRIWRRLQAVKPSRDVSRASHERDFGRSRELLASLARAKGRGSSASGGGKGSKGKRGAGRKGASGAGGGDAAGHEVQAAEGVAAQEPEGQQEQEELNPVEEEVSPGEEEAAAYGEAEEQAAEQAEQASAIVTAS